MQSHFDYDHEFIIDILNALSSPKRQVSKKGVCAGITMLAVQAFLIGELPTFSQRMDKMYRIWLGYGGRSADGFDKKRFKQRVDTIQSQLAKHSSTSPPTSKNKDFDIEDVPFDFEMPEDITEDDIINIIASQNIIYLYQHPSKCIKLFGEKLSQNNIGRISALAASKKLEDLVNVDNSLPSTNNSEKKPKDILYSDNSWPGIYSQQQLFQYCHALNEAAKFYGEKFSLILESENHRITLCYEAGNWILIDPARLPIKQLTAMSLASELNKSLTEDGSSITCFQTIVTTTIDKKDKIDNMVTYLKSLKNYSEPHQINSDKLILENSYLDDQNQWQKSNLLTLSLGDGYATQVEEILQKSPSLIITSGLVFHSTANRGDVKMMKLLAQHAKHLTPEAFFDLAQIARSYDSIEALTELMKFEPQFRKVAWSIAASAIEKNQENILDFLFSKQKLLFEHPGGGGLTLAYEAAKVGNVKILENLQTKFSFLKDNKQFWFLAKTAVKHNQVYVLNFLAEFQPQLAQLIHLPFEELKIEIKKLESNENLKLNQKPVGSIALIPETNRNERPTKEEVFFPVQVISDNEKKLLKSIRNMVCDPTTTKEKLLDTIRDSSLDPTKKIEIYNEILTNQDSELGKFFRVKRGSGLFSRTPRLGAGTLSTVQKLKTALENELTTKNPKKSGKTK